MSKYGCLISSLLLHLPAKRKHHVCVADIFICRKKVREISWFCSCCDAAEMYDPAVVLEWGNVGSMIGKVTLGKDFWSLWILHQDLLSKGESGQCEGTWWSPYKVNTLAPSFWIKTNPFWDFENWGFASIRFDSTVACVRIIIRCH